MSDLRQLRNDEVGVEDAGSVAATISTRRAAAMVAHIDRVMRELVKRKDAIESAIFLLEVEIDSLGRVREWIMSGGVDKYERCKRCGDPHFCHEKDECSGEPHSGGCDCTLAKYEPGGDDE